MEKRTIDNNEVLLYGEVVSEKEFSHEVYGEGFYTVMVNVSRLSGTNDTIPVLISDRMEDFEKIIIGTDIKVWGQFRSFNRHEEGKNRLVLYVFSKYLELNPEEKDADNSITLHGYVCKPTEFRTTPMGRNITDILIAVNRPYGKSDYIPCICWGRNASYAESLEIGDSIKLSGRIQSREYIKTIDNSQEKRIAYEVSASRIERCE